jgi:phosphoglycerate dehydrogenase-like enzyme
MTVIVSERKGASPTATQPGRTEFYEMLEKSDVVVLCCPLDGSTRGIIGLAELKHMRKDAILVNVSRGGTVDEATLATALKEHWIGAAATDVFAVEPASASSSPLLADDVPNLTLSPLVAWYADLKRSIKSNIESFVKGTPENMVS